MNEFIHLAEMLRKRAAEQPKLEVYSYLSSNLDVMASWRLQDLETQALIIASRLRRVCKPNDRVLLMSSHGPGFIASFFGCLYADVIAVPIQPLVSKHNVSRLEAIARATDSHIGVTSSDLLLRLRATIYMDDHHQIDWITSDERDDQLISDAYLDVKPTAGSIAYLQYTSGSTSLPRGVMISHANVLSNLRAIDDDFHHSSNSVSVTWLPYYHDMGLVYGLLAPLYGGFPCYILSSASFSQRPLCWLEAITQFRATHSGGPNFAYDLCARQSTKESSEKLDLTSWQVAFNGAETVRRATIENFINTFAESGFHRKAFYPTYGLAEATLKVTGAKYVDLLTAVGESVSTNLEVSVPCGVPALATDVLIVDPQSQQVLPDGETGEIWVAGPGVALGYWCDPEATLQVFQARLAGTEVGNPGTFLRTGDIGSLKRRELTISGRLKDLIVIRGQNYHPEDLEWTIKSALLNIRNHASRASAAFASDAYGEDRLVVMHEVGIHLPQELEKLETTIRQSIASDYGIQVYAIVFAVHLPRTSSGKIKRHECRRLFLEGSASILHINVVTEEFTSSQDEVVYASGANINGDTPISLQAITQSLVEKAQHILRTALSSKRLHVPLAGLGIDSIASLQICHFIQLEFSVEIPLAIVLESSLVTLAQKIDAAICLRDAQGVTRVSESTTEHSITLPLSSEQERMWMMQQISPLSPAYNLSAAVRISGKVDSLRLRRALTDIELRHEYLRAEFHYVNGALTGRLSPRQEAVLTVVNLSETININEDDIQRAIHGEINRAFDLSSGPLARSLLIRLSPDSSIVLLVVHHIVADLWSLRLLVREIYERYSELSNTTVLPVGRPTGKTYREVISRQTSAAKYHENQIHLEYWRQELLGAPQSLSLPFDNPCNASRTYKAMEQVAPINDLLFTSLQAFAERENTTIYAVLAACYAVLLSRISQANDIIIATPYANRESVDSASTVGLFAMPLPLRLLINEDMTFGDILRSATTKIRKAIEHHHASLTEIVEQAGVKREPGRLKLAQVFFSLDHGLLNSQQIGDLFVEPYDLDATSMDFDLSLRVTVELGKVTARLCYAADLFKGETALNIMGCYQDMLGRVVSDCHSSLRQFKTPTLAVSNKADEQTETISIAATFTAEPLLAFLSFWSTLFDFPVKVEFAPAGQVFQPLLGSRDGWVTASSRIRVIMIRVEDWGQDSLLLNQTVHEFIRVLSNEVEKGAARHLVFICPKSPRVSSDAGLASLIVEAESVLTAAIGAMSNVVLLSGVDAGLLYSVRKWHDESADALGKVPYTDELYAAIATSMFRVFVSMSRSPKKAIACDCDNTLWKGIVAEDGVDGLYITNGNRFTQNILLNQKRSGVLLCLCSKNEEVDIAKAFDCLPGLLIERTDFIASRINWLPKSVNLQQMSTQLQLGLDTFVFVDDDPMECVEVASNCPEVVTVELPKGDNVEEFLKHHWAFDVSVRTPEALRRTELYRDKHKREDFETAFSTIEEYVESLELNCCIVPMTPAHLQRVVELMYRTNQFNTTGLKLTVGELTSRLSLTQIEILAFQLTDKFGDYGLVGATLYSVCGDELVLEVMLLSCRALGRGVEYRMMSECAKIARERGLSTIVANFVRSERNRPALDFLERTMAKRREERQLLRYAVSTVSALNVKPHYSYAKNTSNTISDSSKDHTRPLKTNDSTNNTHMSALLMKIATSLTTGEAILIAARSGKTGTSSYRTVGRRPKTLLEKAVTQIWSDCLGIEICDVNRDFVEIGGDSLKALRIAAQIQNTFKITLSLATFFEGGASIEAMCSSMEAVGYNALNLVAIVERSGN